MSFAFFHPRELWLMSDLPNRLQSVGLFMNIDQCSVSIIQRNTAFSSIYLLANARSHSKRQFSPFQILIHRFSAFSSMFTPKTIDLAVFAFEMEAEDRRHSASPNYSWRSRRERNREEGKGGERELEKSRLATKEGYIANKRMAFGQTSCAV